MTSSTRISMTTWPAGHQSVPAVACFPVALSDGVIAVDWEKEGEPGDVWPEELSENLHVRELFALDASDDEQLREFVFKYGWFCKPGWQSLPACFTHAGGLLDQLRPEVREGLPRSFSREGGQLGPLQPRLAAIDALIGGVQVARQLRRQIMWKSTRAYRGFIHVEEMRVHVEFLRNAVRVWQALSDESPVADIVDEWEGELGLPQLLASGWEVERAALVYLRETLNAGLAEFRVRVELRDDELRTRDEPEVTTYEALALQLFNDVAAGRIYRRCANEKCGKLFLPVPMREKYGSGEFHGEKYCSTECSKAQASREYRRRQKAERAATEDS